MVEGCQLGTKSSLQSRASYGRFASESVIRTFSANICKLDMRD